MGPLLLLASFSTFLFFNAGIQKNSYFSLLNNKNNFLAQKVIQPTYYKTLSFYSVENQKLFKLWTKTKLEAHPFKFLSPYFLKTINHTNSNDIQKSHLYNQQEKLICKIVDRLFDENNTESIGRFIPELLNCHAIFEYHSDLKVLIEKQKENPSMWTFIDDILAIPEEKLPPKIAEVRTMLQKKMAEMSLWQKMKFVPKISNKFIQEYL